MTRIYDAIQKAAAVRPPAPAPEPVHDPARVPILPGPRATAEPGLGRVAAYPLAAALEIDEDTLRQMTMLRVNLEAALPDRTHRVVAFVASQSGEGTTTVARQFASALARDERQRTAIIDANVQNPSIIHDPDGRVARFTGAHDGHGGIAMMNLHGWPLPEEILEAGLFQPGVARAVVQALAPSYDWLILDLPPVLESPDAGPLAGIAEGTVLVVQAGRTKRPVVARSMDLMRKAGARVLGTVLNRRRLEIPEFIYRRI